MFDYTNTNELIVEPTKADEPNSSILAGTNLAAVATELAAAGESPVSEADLTSWEIYEEQLSYHAAVEMDLPVASVDATLDRQVLIRDVMRYATVQAGDADRDYGVAIRLVVTVSAAKLDGELTIPVVAAKAELGMLSAAARLRVLGFKSNKVGDLLPDFATLDVGNYGKYTESSDAIRNFISKNPQAVFPVLLRSATQPTEIETRLLEATAGSRALRSVANHESLQTLLEKVGDRWPQYSAAVTKAYGELAPGTKPNDQPSKEQAELAKRWTTWL